MLLAERMAIGHSTLKKSHTFAVVGVSQERQKYGYEVFRARVESGYKVYLSIRSAQKSMKSPITRHCRPCQNKRKWL